MTNKNLSRARANVKCNSNTGYMGVSKKQKDGKYYASIKINNKDYHIGMFKILKDAVEARALYIKDKDLSDIYPIEIYN